jgi:hypothetical protein
MECGLFYIPMRIKAFMIDSAKAIVGFAHRFGYCFVSGPDFSRAAISSAMRGFRSR